MFGANPGADDNASGTAGLLEMARLLRDRPLARRVDLVAFTLEEPPFFATEGMGSRVHARALRAAGVRVEAMVGLEMIGYFSERQPWPSALLALVYPRRGDFAGVVGRPLDGGLARRVKGWMRVPPADGPAVPVYSFNGPTMMGTDASDHASFWQEGMPAVMVTDTAFMRNPHYHGPGDRPGTLDYRRMATVVDGVLNAVLHLAGTGRPSN
jgi:Zn-dependent M28 family amino/carboxypeptidase